MINIFIIGIVFIIKGIAALFGYIKIPRKYSVYSWSINYKRICGLGDILYGCAITALKIASSMTYIPYRYILLSIFAITLTAIIYATVQEKIFNAKVLEATKENHAYSS